MGYAMKTVYQPRGRILRSIGALLAGLTAGVILSIGTDSVLQAAGLFPSSSQPYLYTTMQLLIATVYRTLFSVVGSYVAAWLAPNRPMGHAMVLGAVGLVATSVGAVVMWGIAPSWYLLALIVLAMPSAWLGGKLHSVRADA